MAGKMSTIVMMVDLECDRCYRKIRRVLCKLQDKASIKAISYDEKNNTVTVAGPFDADEVSDRLCSSAGKVITDIRVVGGAKPMPGGGGGGAKAHANKPAGKDGSGGGGGGKPEMIKKHVKFEMADDMDDGRHHHHHDNRKPKVVTTTNHAAGALARMEGRRAEAPSMAMAAAMAPAPMPMTVQATATPSIWPAPAPSAPAPLEWGHSAPTYGAGWAPPPAGGYYGGGGGPMYYGQPPPPPAYGYGGRSPYQPPYYDEEPAGCSVM